MQIPISSRKGYRYVGAILILLVAVSVFGQVYKFVFYNGQDRYIVEAFNIDAEFNFPTLFISLLMGLCAVLLLLISIQKSRDGDKYRRHWRILGVIFVMLATDELLMLHEKTTTPIRALIGADNTFFPAWTIPAALFLIILFIALFKFLLDLPGKTRIRFLSAGALFVIGALGIELINGRIFLSRGENNLLYALMTNLEELFEYAGILVFYGGLLDYVKETYGELTITLSDR